MAEVFVARRNGKPIAVSSARASRSARDRGTAKDEHAIDVDEQRPEPGRRRRPLGVGHGASMVGGRGP